MFSSNQVLDITGSLDQIEQALKFALDFSGHSHHLVQSEIDRGCKTVFQITDDGKYCIGWGFREVPSGWYEYQFRPEISIISAIIRQRMADAKVIDDGCDGSYEPGFRMKNIEGSFAEEKSGIKNPFYGIVFFEPFTCFYHK